MEYGLDAGSSSPHHCPDKGQFTDPPLRRPASPQRYRIIMGNGLRPVVEEIVEPESEVVQATQPLDDSSLPPEDSIPPLGPSGNS
jgi:hypothetical protein